jgi:2'-5' RNA ligase
LAGLARGSRGPAPEGLLPVSDWLQGQLAIFVLIYGSRDLICDKSDQWEKWLNYGRHELRAHYDAMWQESWPRVRMGDVVYDSQLTNKDCDVRRGLSVIARLQPSVTEQLGNMLETLSAIEPHQYYYPLADIHLTILSLFTTTEHYQSHLERLDEYRDAVAMALKSGRSFIVDAVGLTLSRSAVMVQGFPHDTMLNHIRGCLRTELVSRGLDHSLDQRYRLFTAHSTLLRFTSPLQAPEEFCSVLAGFRSEFFGASAIASLDLVINDWYMSSETLTKIEAYQLEQHPYSCRDSPQSNRSV